MKLLTNRTRLYISAIAFALFSASVSAAEKTEPATGPDPLMTNGVFLVMLSFAVLLLLGIIGMAELVKASATHRRDRQKKEQSNSGVKSVLLILALGCSSFLFGQETVEAVVPEPPFTYWGMGATVFYTMLFVIFAEAVIFYVLFRTGMQLLRKEKALTTEKKKRGWLMDSAIMKSMTDAVSPEEEKAIMTDHDYDGIRELDNNLPGWWKYGFYLTIVVSVVYMLHYHVLGTGRTSVEEYLDEQKAAEKSIAEYKRSAANLVDENTVVQLTDAASLSAGRSVYLENCVPCHGEQGEGKEGLGPNLTDDYWVHEGGTVGIFKSIKYGWTDKGMKSWQQDLKPLEIQQIVSWIQSIRGTEPANAKAPEGKLYVEEGTAPEKDTMQTDSARVIPATDSIK